jgi:PAS domain S-box-containing protein
VSEVVAGQREGQAFVLLGRIASIVSNTSEIDAALREALAEIIRYSGYPIAHASLVHQGSVVGAAAWHVADPSGLPGFGEVGSDFRLGAGQGLLATVLESARAVWLSDAQHDGASLRRTWANRVGVRGMLGFPLVAEDEIFGVIELFSGEAAEPDDELLRALGVVGNDLGRMIERARAAAVARDGEERYRLLFESATDAIFLEDQDGVLLSMNPAATQLTGYRLEELQGKQVDLVIAPEYRELSRVQSQRKLRGEVASTRHESVIIDRSGRRIPVEVSSALVHSDGAVVGVQAVVRNVDADRRAENALRESEERFRGAFDASVVGMALAAPDGRWLQVNDALCRLLGYDADALLTMRYQDVTHPDDLESDLALARRMLAGELPAYQMEKRYLRPDGSIVWGHLSVALIRGADGTAAYTVAQILDITDQKRAEVERAAGSSPRVDHDRSSTPLSPREREVLTLLAAGDTSAEVAARLGIGEETVQTHVRRSMAKLSARTRTEAVAIALRAGWLDHASA